MAVELSKQSTHELKLDNYYFVTLLEKHGAILFDKSRVPYAIEAKSDAVASIISDIANDQKITCTSKQVLRKIAVLKSKVKQKADLRQTGNKPIALNQWENRFWTLLDGDENPSITKVPCKVFLFMWIIVIRCSVNEMFRITVGATAGVVQTNLKPAVRLLHSTSPGSRISKRSAQGSLEIANAQESIEEAGPSHNNISSPSAINVTSQNSTTPSNVTVSNSRPRKDRAAHRNEVTTIDCIIWICT